MENDKEENDELSMRLSQETKCKIDETDPRETNIKDFKKKGKMKPNLKILKTIKTSKLQI